MIQRKKSKYKGQKSHKIVPTREVGKKGFRKRNYLLINNPLLEQSFFLNFWRKTGEEKWCLGVYWSQTGYLSWDVGGVLCWWWCWVIAWCVFLHKIWVVPISKVGTPRLWSQLGGLDRIGELSTGRYHSVGVPPAPRHNYWGGGCGW